MLAASKPWKIFFIKVFALGQTSFPEFYKQNEETNNKTTQLEDFSSKKARNIHGGLWAL